MKVYRGLWRGSEVAVKQLLNEKLNEKEVARFIYEGKVLASLRPHSNILQYGNRCLPTAVLNLLFFFE